MLHDRCNFVAIVLFGKWSPLKWTYLCIFHIFISTWKIAQCSLKSLIDHLRHGQVVLIHLTGGVVNHVNINVQMQNVLRDALAHYFSRPISIQKINCQLEVGSKWMDTDAVICFQFTCMLEYFPFYLRRFEEVESVWREYVFVAMLSFTVNVIRLFVLWLKSQLPLLPVISYIN